MQHHGKEFVLIVLIKSDVEVLNDGWNWGPLHLAKM
jgi:hypothetical protein